LLASDGRALELGIGTGRIALPLAARGVPVHGIELSRAMAARLAAKPGGASVEVTIGDFSTTRLDRSFRVTYLVFNTIMNLTSQDAQVACFQNVADHLEPGGCFVIEVMVPELRKLSETGTVVPFLVTESRLGFDEYDTATQAMSSHHVHLSDGSEHINSIPFRYVWPAELDLMAQMAGMRLRNRWADWSGTPFTSFSPSHVSVWEKIG
jgi:SAM-dependent methyltransferase